VKCGFLLAFPYFPLCLYRKPYHLLRNNA
jgi:hypothetical protein